MSEGGVAQKGLRRAEEKTRFGIFRKEQMANGVKVARPEPLRRSLGKESFTRQKWCKIQHHGD